MQITRGNYSQYANMVQQMFGNKKNSNNPLAQCDYGNFALRFKPVDIQFTKPNWDNIMTERDKPAMSEEEFEEAIKELARKEFATGKRDDAAYRKLCMQHLNDFLNAVISEGVREGITDIFGQGVEIDDSEAVQTARRAKELLDKLAEYKPLAKVEELTEQNYNMIDNVLNNGAEKKEQEQTKGRISIKEKLAEKKAVIEQRDKAERTSPEKETEKKSQREM